MAPTFLVAGSTGNTGTTVVETLSKLIGTIKSFSRYEVLALTRNINGVVPQRFTKLRHVRVVEKNYIDITPEWLLEHDVKRSFLAPAAGPSHFAEESAFNLALLKAGVEYHVRIATAPMNMRSDNPAFYTRNHWAIEQQLLAPEFEKLHWTSIRPNLFISDYLKAAVAFVKQYRETGEQGTLRLSIAKNQPFPLIHAGDIGVVAAYLLHSEDTTSHNKGRYTLNGPEDITGADTVKFIEDIIGDKVKDVRFKDNGYLFDSTVAAAITMGIPKSIISTVYTSFDSMWNGEWRDWPTSESLLKLGLPQQTMAEVFNKLLSDSS